MSDRTPSLSKRDAWFAVMIGAVLVSGFLVCIQRAIFPFEAERTVRRIIRASDLRNPEAIKLARHLADRFPSSPFYVALAANAAANCSEHELAMDYFRELPLDSGRWEFFRNLGLAKRCEIRGALSDEERYLRRALEINPHDLEASERLGHLLQVSGRTWESAPYFEMQIRRGKCRGDELIGMAVQERFFRADERLETAALAAIPPEPSAKLALARRHLMENRTQEAETLLKEVIAAAPGIGEAQGRLGRIIYERGDPIEFLQWRGGLPDAARNHPEVWFVQGLQARRQGQREGAIRCFYETLNLSPNHLGANVQIASGLEQLGHTAIAQTFAQRGQALEELEAALNLVRTDMDLNHFRHIIGSLGKLGRYWEAAGWTYVMKNLANDQAEARREIAKWLRLANSSDRSSSSLTLALATVRSLDFAEPRWSAPANTSSRQTTNVETVKWKFQDQADEVGIHFQYDEGTTEQTRLEHIFNTVGGGLAAVDYDVDGWCDLHLAQANNWRDPTPQPEHFDRLFRNILGQNFVDVTKLAGVGDLGFSHGIASGDFDQDGFPDLYIGNLGPNRLYHNNGDGTFSDITETAGVAGNEWTTSVTFADFNSDGHPDLYVANYSILDETAKKECHKKSGERMACTPDLLTAEYHRLYVNGGDGRFHDQSAPSGMRQPNGRGLGLIAWDFAGEDRLSLFVANDTSPNFLFRNMGNNPDGVPQFSEEGIVQGVALDVDGNAQASMGIAAGDINRDGRIDMFITNFFGESDSLYSQRADGFFDDVTRKYGLTDPGFWMLGFGCQFGDFDSDGWDDLIVTNGHVDRESRRGDPDRTRPQLFRNRQGVKFDEAPSEQLGNFFQKGYLGRGLATLDWNGDGRLDFAVSHLHDPFALVTNQTDHPENKSLVIRLVGRKRCRVPMGAVVRLRSDAKDIPQFVVGGCGYLVTNEFGCRFATPRNLDSVQISVQWPGGALETWDNIETGQEIVLVEGRSQPEVLRRFDKDLKYSN